MKPFNLEAALAGEPVVTRDGRDVTNLVYFPDAGGVYKIAGVLDECVETFTEEGFFFNYEEQSAHDLFMKPKKRTVWVNFYGFVDFANCYESEEEANRSPISKYRVGNKAFPLEIEE